MSRRRLVIAALALAALAIIVTWWTMKHASGPFMSTASIAPDRATASPKPEQPPIGNVDRSVAATAAASAPSVDATDLAAQVDRWAASGDPADAMRAYRTVHDCLEARRDERRPSEDVSREREAFEESVHPGPNTQVFRQWKRSAALCGNLRSDQIQTRMQWLMRAAAAGVPMAAMDFIYEGPGGDGMLQDLNVPRAPLTDTWRAQRDAYIDAGLQQCDEGLVGYLGLATQGNARNAAEAMMFWQTHARCAGDTARPPLSNDAGAVRLLSDLGSAGLLPAAPASAP
jgi:hypothetical protein